MLRIARFGLVLAATIGLGALAGCGDDKQAPEKGKPAQQTVTLMTMQLRPTFDAYFDPIIKDFEAKHPGAKVEWVDFPFQDYETKLTTSLLGSNPPDVINLPQESISNYVEAGQLLELDQYLSQEQRAEYVPGLLLEGGTFDGKLMALPWYAVSDVTLVNSELMEKAGLGGKIPATYTEIPEICRIVREKTGVFGYFPLYTENGYLRQYLLDAGVQLVDKTGTKATFNTAKGVETLTWWTDLYKNKLVPSEALTATHRRPLELFQSGKLAVLYTAPQFVKTIKQESADIYAKTIVAPRLQWPDTERYNVALHMMCVAKKSQQPALAAELAAVITNAENQLQFSKITTTTPSITKALNDPYFKDVENTPEGQARRICAEQVAKSSVFRAPKHGAVLNKILDELTEKTAQGELTPADAIKQAEERWNEALAH